MNKAGDLARRNPASNNLTVQELFAKRKLRHFTQGTALGQKGNQFTL